MSQKIEIADIATGEKRQLKGFKIVGVFPFYLSYITTGTHIALCRIKEQIQEIKTEEPKASDFYDSVLQTNLIPLINDYIVTALVNGRNFGFIFRWLLMGKIKRSGHYHILNLYVTILKLDEPAFFLSYWNSITTQDHTLLKEAKPS